MRKWFLATMVVLLAAGVVTGAGLHAREGDVRTTVFASSGVFRAGGNETTGTVYGGGWGLEIQDKLMWKIGASYGSTTGNREVDGQAVPLTANFTELRTGLTLFFKPNRTVVPFAGGGLSVTAYDMDFAYQNSEIGKTSGTGGGVFGDLGFEVRLGGGFTLIPFFRVSIHTITSDQGVSRSLLSEGAGIAFSFSA